MVHRVVIKYSKSKLAFSKKKTYMPNTYMPTPLIIWENHIISIIIWVGVVFTWGHA